jgi:ficolin
MPGYSNTRCLVLLVFVCEICSQTVLGQVTTTSYEQQWECGDNQRRLAALLEKVDRMADTIRILLTQSQQQLLDGITQMSVKVSTASSNPFNNPLPRDCTDVMRMGNDRSGVYTIYVGTLLPPVQVYCDMLTDGGGWLVFQRRLDGSENFYRSWSDYTAGFGQLMGEFWLGNDILHSLTTSKAYSLRVDLSAFNGTSLYAAYSNFKIASSFDKYRLASIGNYAGTAGDSLTYHIGQQFSTHDQDNDIDSGSCSEIFKGAWWYASCHQSNLNGLYLKGSHSSYADGVQWNAFTGRYYSLKFTEMKIRPRDRAK